MIGYGCLQAVTCLYKSKKSVDFFIYPSPDTLFETVSTTGLLISFAAKRKKMAVAIFHGAAISFLPSF